MNSFGSTGYGYGYGAESSATITLTNDIASMLNVPHGVFKKAQITMEQATAFAAWLDTNGNLLTGNKAKKMHEAAAWLRAQVSAAASPSRAGPGGYRTPESGTTHTRPAPTADVPATVEASPIGLGWVLAAIGTLVAAGGVYAYAKHKAVPRANRRRRSRARAR